MDTRTKRANEGRIAASGADTGQRLADDVRIEQTLIGLDVEPQADALARPVLGGAAR